MSGFHFSGYLMQVMIFETPMGENSFLFLCTSSTTTCWFQFGWEKTANTPLRSTLTASQTFCHSNCLCVWTPISQDSNANSGWYNYVNTVFVLHFKFLIATPSKWLILGGKLCLWEMASLGLRQVTDLLTVRVKLRQIAAQSQRLQLQAQQGGLHRGRSRF